MPWFFKSILVTITRKFLTTESFQRTNLVFHEFLNSLKHNYTLFIGFVLSHQLLISFIQTCHNFLIVVKCMWNSWLAYIYLNSPFDNLTPESYFYSFVSFILKFYIWVQDLCQLHSNYSNDLNLLYMIWKNLWNLWWNTALAW